MADDDSSESEKNTAEVVPYKFKQKEAGVGKKLDASINNFSAKRKTIAIIAGILILVLVGGAFTGNIIKTNTELKKCQSGLEEAYTQAAVLSNNITKLQGNLFDLDGNLSTVRAEKDICEADFSVCSTEKATVKSEKDVLSADLSDAKTNLKKTQSDLSSCNSDVDNLNTQLSEKEQELDQAKSDQKEIEQKYAALVCCPVFFPQGYNYYVSLGGDILCCYKNENMYVCGFGPNEQETDEGQVNRLEC